MGIETRDLVHVEQKLSIDDLRNKDNLIVLSRSILRKFNASVNKLERHERETREGTLYKRLCKCYAFLYNNDIRSTSESQEQWSDVSRLINALKNNEAKKIQFLIQFMNVNTTTYDILRLVTKNTKEIHFNEMSSCVSYLPFLFDELEANVRFSGVKTFSLIQTQTRHIDNNNFETKEKVNISMELFKKRKIYLKRLTFVGQFSIRNIEFIGLEYLYLLGTSVKNCKLRDLKTIVINRGDGLWAIEFLHNFIVECECTKLETAYLCQMSDYSYFESLQKENILEKIRKLCPKFVGLNL